MERSIATLQCRRGAVAIFARDLPIAEALRRYGEWAEQEIDLLGKLLPQGGTAIDVGAHVGGHTLAFSRAVGAEGQVLAFEPQPALCRLLLQNLQANDCKNAVVREEALADAPTVLWAPLPDYAEPGNFGAVSFATGENRGDDVMHVRANSLDKLCQRRGELALKRCDLIKIDAEGFEAKIIAGAQHLIKRLRPVLYIEANNIEPTWSIVRKLRRAGYNVFLHTPPAFNPANRNEDPYDVFRGACESALLAVPTDRAEKLGPVVDRALWLAKVENLDGFARMMLEVPRYADPDGAWVSPRAVARYGQTLQREAHASAERAAVAKTRADAAEKRLHQESARILTAQTEARRAAERVGAAETRADAAEKRLHEEGERLLVLQAEIRQTAERVGAAEARADAAEKRLREQSERLSDLQAEARQAAERVGTAEARADAAEGRLREESARLATTQVEAVAWAERVAAAETRADAAERRLREESERVLFLLREVRMAAERTGAVENPSHHVKRSFSWRVTGLLHWAGQRLMFVATRSRPRQPQIVTRHRGDMAVNFNIEKANRRFGRLVVRGWAIHENARIVDAELVVGNGTESSATRLEAGLSRPDVAEATGSPHGRLSGFRGFTANRCNNPSNVTLRLVFAGDQVTKLDLNFGAFKDDSIAKVIKILRSRECRKKLVRLFFTAKFGLLAHTLRSHLFVQNLETLNAINLQIAAELIREKAIVSKSLPEPIDVIIPVYNGLDHLPRLFDSLFCNTTTPCRFIVIDDASPDQEVFPYLHKRLNGRDNVFLKSNESNLGFVETVNRATKEVKGHFVLLNSDVEVPPGWLERLMAPIFANSDIASTTPFSNAATIFSFPYFAVDNPLPEGLTTSEIDEQFSRLLTGRAPSLDAPTGVGFCMGVNGQVWREIGDFDSRLFGRGYGEENDWCRRAAAKGKRNVLVPNVFVYHASGGSFSKSDKEAQTKRNLRLLAKRWPDYGKKVQAFIADDPWSSLRAAATLALCLSPAARALLIFDHDVGGGANEYRKRLLERAHAAGRATILCNYDKKSKSIRIEANWRNLHTTLKIDREKADVIADLAIFGKPEEVVYNNLVGWRRPDRVIKAILKIKVATGARLVFLFHDYFAVCPSYQLLDADGRSCGVPRDLSICRECLSRNPYAEPRALENIDDWRRQWQSALAEADEIVFFSEASRKLAERAYRLDKAKAKVIPHEPVNVFERKPKISLDPPITIGVVGSIGYHKGSEIVGELSRLLARKRPGGKIVVIGEISKLNQLHDNMIVTGRYDAQSLPKLLEDHKVTIALFPSIWPETFSYVTQELISLDVPLVCFDLGAPAERVGAYSKGLVANDVSAASALAAIEALETKLAAGARRSTSDNAYLVELKNSA